MIRGDYMPKTQQLAQQFKNNLKFLDELTKQQIKYLSCQQNPRLK